MWKYIVAAFVAFLFFVSPALATHNVGNGAQVGEAPSVIAWCQTADDVRAAIQANEDEAYGEFISQGSNSCIDVRVARSMGFLIEPLKIGVLEIVEGIVIQDGKYLAEVIKAVSADEKIVYTWHWVAARGA